MKDFFKRTMSDPLGVIKRGIFKVIIGPIKYKRGEDYNASKYWHDRFSAYGPSFRAVGDEGLSEEENARLYAEGAQGFLDVCAREGINFAAVRTLEVGCGTGFYTRLLRDVGVKSYVGIDVTDVFFPHLRKEFPSFVFVRRDVTADKIEGEFDLVVMMDVMEHVVSNSRLDFAMANIRSCLASKGVFVVGPIMRESYKRFFYLRFWSLNDLRSRFEGFTFGAVAPFKGGPIVSIRKPEVAAP